MTLIDCGVQQQQQQQQQHIKRKFDDYIEDDDEQQLLLLSSDSVVRMRKPNPSSFTSYSDNSVTNVNTSTNHQFNHTTNCSNFQHEFARVSSSSTQNPIVYNPPNHIQFFVRTLSPLSSSNNGTLVLHAKPTDTVESIHDQIQSITGIPVTAQRLIYGGKQLQFDDSLAQCRITKDSELQLVGRMRSAKHPEAWIIIDGLESLICRLCKGETLGVRDKPVSSRLEEYVELVSDKTTIDTAIKYLHIFHSSSIPAALVMLYVSPIYANKGYANEAIQVFFKSYRKLLEDDKAKLPIYIEFAPIVLRFCKLLATAVTHDDLLYTFCRNYLASMMEYVKLGMIVNTFDVTSSIYKKADITVQDIFPFVNQIATQLSRDLVSSMESVVNSGLLASDVLAFSSFLRSLRVAIIDQVSFGGTFVPMQHIHKLPWCSDEIKCLYTLFHDLLAKMQMCLDKVEDYITVRKDKGDVGWDQYLSILRELFYIAQLYQGAEESFWTSFRHNKVSLCYLIVTYAKRGEDYTWIFEHKELTDFESRRHLVMMLLPDVKDEYEDLLEMLIGRSQLLAESFEYISGAEPKTLQGGIFMEFKNEEATGPGVLREWFFLVCQAIFDPQNALFVACPNDRRRFFPNPASKVDPMHLKYFKFAGRVIALALMHKMQVGIVFSRAFFLQLAGLEVCLEDIKDADPYLYHSCKQILDMDPREVDEDALGLTFVWEVEELGSVKVLELLPNGKHITVNSRNRKEYVDLLIKHQFVTSVAQQVSKFAQGFADIVTNHKLCFKGLEHEDLDGMLRGSESSISVDDWKAHTEYNGYYETDPQISWFWKIVGEMTAEQRNVLLFFWTSIKYLPVEGFRGLASRLYIYKSNETIERLPSSHTCFYRICFPAYPSMDVMKQRLNVITQEHVGCSFGTW
ncbi:E3 ubiquitin-protein ligase UPL5-like [Rutidosis leptorrhynchoides]|uniref:E3 ubiquitin-protein ligase UPL5-like n=1 Tax=Rutidosis leptorrhynchoides TaxID=125765 RepID=UPI003A9A0329